MKQIIVLLVACLGGGAAFFASAHPGHDNQHWLAGVIHSFWVWPVLAIVVFVLVALFKPKSVK